MFVSDRHFPVTGNSADEEGMGGDVGGAEGLRVWAADVALLLREVENAGSRQHRTRSGAELIYRVRRSDETASVTGEWRRPGSGPRHSGPMSDGSWS